MRVVGYVREAPGPHDGDTVFAQSERIRRWALKNGYQVVAMCQDPRSAEHPSERDGYRALLGILDAEQADLVVLPSLAVLSADKIDQEILLRDLRRRGASVAVVEDAEQDALAEPPRDAARRFIRDVLSKRESHETLLREERPTAPPAPEVVVEIVPGPEPSPTPRKARSRDTRAS